MNRRRAIGLTLALLILAALGWRFGRFAFPRSSEQTAQPGTASPASAAAATRTTATTPPAAGDSALAAALNSPSTDIRADLRLVAEILDTFRTNFPRDGNPTGTNADITAALTGHNKLQLRLVSPQHPAINAAGELCDRWGTPFFFHAESGTRMEIRSAGPDRKLWTDDDVTFTP